MQIPNVRYTYDILSLDHFSWLVSAAYTHIPCLLGLDWLYSNAASFLVVAPGYKYLQNAGSLAANWVLCSLIASLMFSSSCQDSASLYDSFNPEPFIFHRVCTFTINLSWSLTVSSLSYFPWFLHVFETSTICVALTITNLPANIRCNLATFGP